MSAVPALRLQHLEKIVAEIRTGAQREYLLTLVKEMDFELMACAEGERIIKEQMQKDQHEADLKTVRAVLAWAEDHPKFSDKYVRSLCTHLIGGPLTEGQRNALEKIIDTWHMELDDYG